MISIIFFYQTEQESVVYQDKVRELRDELSKATREINSMTGEYVAIRDSLEKHNTLMDSLQKENERMRNLLEEYYEEKRNREEHLEKARIEVIEFWFSIYLLCAKKRLS